jgi:hypothetical protein
MARDAHRAVQQQEKLEKQSKRKTTILLGTEGRGLLSANEFSTVNATYGLALWGCIGRAGAHRGMPCPGCGFRGPIRRRRPKTKKKKAGKASVSSEGKCACGAARGFPEMRRG